MTDKKLERLRKLIDNSGKTRQELATALECDTSMVTKHYNGDRAVSVDFLVKYARYFNVTTDYLLGLSESQTTDTNLNAVCKYTGLSENVVQKIQDRKKNIFFKKCLEFLIDDEDFFDLISSYLFSSTYEYFKESEYFQSIKEKDDIYWIVKNYLLIQESKFSRLMEEFPKKKDKIKNELLTTHEIDKLVFYTACRSIEGEKIFRKTRHYGKAHPDKDINNLESAETEENYQQTIFDFYDKYLKYKDQTNTED